MQIKSKVYAFSHPRAVTSCVSELGAGEVIVIPTETVYGVACRMNDQEALKKIQILKGRDFNKPISIMIHDVVALKELDVCYDEKLVPFMEHFWPGPLTLVFNKNSGGTLGVRIPNNGFVLKLLENFGPMHVTSANYSNDADATSFLMASRYFIGKVPLLIDGGKCEFNKSSSVLKVNDNGLDVIRKGPDCKAMLKSFEDLCL